MTSAHISARVGGGLETVPELEVELNYWPLIEMYHVERWQGDRSLGGFWEIRDVGVDFVRQAAVHLLFSPRTSFFISYERCSLTSCRISSVLSLLSCYQALYIGRLILFCEYLVIRVPISQTEQLRSREVM